MKEQPENSNIGVWTGMGLLIVVLVLGLFVRKFSLLILFLLSIGTLIGVIYYFISYAMKWQKGKVGGKYARGAGTEKMEQLRKECSSQIAKYRKEVEEIRSNIKELDHQLNNGFDINPKSIQESQRLSAAFEKEQQLRKIKISFYETCRAKLENLLYNQKLAEDLEDKQQKLNQLQEEHYEDLAQMEELRSAVEYEKQFLDSISELSLRMAGISSLDIAEELQLELQEITKEMRRL